MSFRLGSGATLRSAGSFHHLGRLQLTLLVVSAARQLAPAGGPAANGEVEGKKSRHSTPTTLVEVGHGVNGEGGVGVKSDTRDQRRGRRIAKLMKIDDVSSLERLWVDDCLTTNATF